MPPRIERAPVVVDEGLLILCGDHALLHQLPGIERSRGGVLANLLVHLRLGLRRLFRLVVPPTAIANEVDDHVLSEFHTVIDGQLHGEDHGFRVIAVHVQDRRLHHLRHFRAVLRGPGVFLMAGGKAHLIINDEVNRAAGAVAPGLAHLEGFHDHALPREGGIAVDHHGHHLSVLVIEAPILPGPDATLGHGIHDLEVGRVEGQGHVHFSAGGHHVGGEALVVLHVAGTLSRGHLALKLVKQLIGLLAQNVDEDIQAAPMRHGNHRFHDAMAPGALQALVERRDQRLPALEAKALGAGIAILQILFETLGRRKALEDHGLHLRVVARMGSNAL